MSFTFKRKHLIFLLLAVTLTAIVIIVMKSSPSATSADSFLKQLISDRRTPSVQYAFFSEDTLLYSNMAGVADVRLGQPADDQTTYHIFSVTKTFTALAVLQLAQRGEIDLHKPIKEYLPHFSYDATITIEQLLTHTAGLPNPIPLKWIHLMEEDREFDRDAFFEHIFSEHPELAFPPGTKFKYSNLGYVWLGQLIEQIANQSFESYIEEHILSPANVKHGELGFQIDPAHHAIGYHPYWSVSNVLLGFLFDKSKYMTNRVGQWQPFRYFYNNGVAYGGMTGTRNGLVHYGQALLKDNSVLLNDALKKYLYTGKVINGKSTGMTMSWFTGELNGHRYIAHAGGGGGYYVELRLYPELHKGSVIMFNRSGMTDQRILDQIDRYFLE
jgi:CubicO group peptidase (beta-lactamase class C family)